MNTLKKKVNELFKESAAHERLSEAQAEIDRKEWERRHADIPLCETCRQLESHRADLCLSNQLTGHAYLVN